MSKPLIAHVEIPSTNLDRSNDFYKKVFGWDFKPFGNGYLLFNNHKGIMAGLRKVEKVIKGDCTVFHVNIDNIDADSLEKTKSAGGHLKPGKPLFRQWVGMRLYYDPDGNSVGLFQKN